MIKGMRRGYWSRGMIRRMGSRLVLGRLKLSIGRTQSLLVLIISRTP